MKIIAILGIIGAVVGILGGMIFESFTLLKIGLGVWGVSLGIFASAIIWNHN